MQDSYCVPTICQQELNTEPELRTGDEVCLLQIHPVEIDGNLIPIEQASFSIGRDSCCDLPLVDKSVSRRHALIERNGDTWQISDCGSTNGVVVNDVPVFSGPLKPGDQIRIGTRVLKFLSRHGIETEYHETVYSMMTRDMLTGAFNRRYFTEALDRELHRAIRRQRPLSLLLFDIDHFKSINDTHGHLAGDDVLREMGQRISDSLDRDDILARYGGEEFAVILAETPLADATRFAERCRNTVSETPFSSCVGPIDVSISIGVAEACCIPVAADDLIQQADSQLYRAKNSGRNRVCFD